MQIAYTPTNPGHVLSCLGILSLADAASAVPVLSRFDPDAGVFWLGCDAVVITGIESSGPKDPVTIELGDHRLRLDWWTRPSRRQHQVWTGQQSPLGLLRYLIHKLEASPDGLVIDPDFDELVDAPSSFDSRGAKSSDAVDGRQIIVRSCPWINALAMVGLQLFAPEIDTDGSWLFTTWSDEMAVPVAAAIFPGHRDALGLVGSRYIVSILENATRNGVYRMFAGASVMHVEYEPVRRGNDIRAESAVNWREFMGQFRLPTCSSVGTGAFRIPRHIGTPTVAMQANQDGDGIELLCQIMNRERDIESLESALNAIHEYGEDSE